MGTLVNLLVFSNLFYYFGIVQSSCILKYPDDIETSPRYEKNIGKYRIPLPNNVSEIFLHEGEIVHGFCGAYFRERYGYYYSIQQQTSIKLTCDYGQLKYNDKRLERITLECEKMNSNIFSTDETYSWCDNNRNSKTLLLTTKSHNDYYIFASMCYNLEDFSLQTITYNITASGYRGIDPLVSSQEEEEENGEEIRLQIGLSSSNLGESLWNLINIKRLEISQEQMQQQITEKSKTNSWLSYANYEISSIIQGDSSEKYFQDFNNILNIIWWRNLRLGNWKDFMNTLNNYSNNNSFQLYTGTSDEVKYPEKPNTSLDTILGIWNGFNKVTIPAYIWTYLKSTDNKNRNFVIVGYNSPYVEFFSLNNTIFCPDICSEIPWLSDIYPSFRFSAAGIMFCCSTDFIRQTNRLQGFPLDVLTTNQLENKT